MSAHWIGILGSLALLGFVFTCAPSPKQEAPPWADLDFLHRRSTRFALVNRSPDTLDVNWNNRMGEFGREARHDTLLPGDTFAVTLWLYRPERSYLYVPQFGLRSPHLLPGWDRTLIWNEAGLSEEATAYAPLALVESVLPIQGSGTPVLGEWETIVPYYRRRLDTIHSRLEDYAAEDAHPAWLLDLTRRQAELAAAAELETIRGYRRMAAQDTLDLPDSLRTRMQGMLADAGMTLAPAYTDLRQRSNWIASGDAAQADPNSAASRRLVAWIRNDYPGDRQERLARFVESELHDPATYTVKDELLEGAVVDLPEPYRDYLGSLRDSLQQSRSVQDGARRLLAQDFRSIGGSDVVPGAAYRGEAVLYKLWFPGCVPCVRQYPYERSLRERYPDLRLVYLGYATPFARWQEYVEGHDMPADAHLYWPGSEDSVREAIGMVGAPRYVLTAPSGEVVCSSCPKPDESSLDELVARASGN